MKKKVLVIMLCSILFLGIVGCGKEEEEKQVVAKNISSIEVQRMIEEKENIKIIDVRTKVEYDSGHILDAINIPLDTIQNIDFPFDTKLIVYCQSGNRSKQAANKLIELGYTNIYDLGGIVDWPYEIVEE